MNNSSRPDAASRPDASAEPSARARQAVVVLLVLTAVIVVVLTVFRANVFWHNEAYPTTRPAPGRRWPRT